MLRKSTNDHATSDPPTLKHLVSNGMRGDDGGVLLQLPMLAHAHAMENRLAGMEMDGAMMLGMPAIAAGAAIACYGALRGGRQIETPAPHR